MLVSNFLFLGPDQQTSKYPIMNNDKCSRLLPQPREGFSHSFPIGMPMSQTLLHIFVWLVKDHEIGVLPLTMLHLALNGIHAYVVV